MRFLRELVVYDDREPRSAAANMAVDEALLEIARLPVLRFYRWRRPSISFGYFGRFDDVSEETERELVRRWTGGGIVWHGTDCTYSLVLPNEQMTARLNARAIYTEVHQAIRRALAPHLVVDLAAASAPKLSDACFANPVTADLLAGDKKVAGAAQRRTRRGLLQQGSIQLEAVPDYFKEAFARELSEQADWAEILPEITMRAETLAAEKYGTIAWLRRR